MPWLSKVHSALLTRTIMCVRVCLCVCACMSVCVCSNCTMAREFFNIILISNLISFQTRILQNKKKERKKKRKKERSIQF